MEVILYIINAHGTTLHGIIPFSHLPLYVLSCWSKDFIRSDRFWDV